MLVCMDPLADMLPKRGGTLKWEKPVSHRIRVELEGTSGHKWVDLYEKDGKLVLMACEPISIKPETSNLVAVEIVGFPDRGV